MRRGRLHRLLRRRRLGGAGDVRDAPARGRGSRAEFRLLPGVQGQGRSAEDVPLGFDDGTVFSREDIGQTADSRPCFPNRRTATSCRFRATRRATCFGARSIGSHRFRPDIPICGGSALHRRLHEGTRNRAVAVDRAYYHYRFHSGSVTEAFQLSRAGELRKIQRRAGGAFGGSAWSACRRMKIRRRKMAVGTVRNFCYPGTPYVLGSACAARRHI